MKTAIIITLLSFAFCSFAQKNVSGEFVNPAVKGKLVLNLNGTFTYSFWACNEIHGDYTGHYYVSHDSVFLTRNRLDPQTEATLAPPTKWVLFTQFGHLYREKTKWNYLGEIQNSIPFNSPVDIELSAYMKQFGE